MSRICGFITLVLAIALLVLPTGQAWADNALGNLAQDPNACDHSDINANDAAAAGSAGQLLQQDLNKAWGLMPKIEAKLAYCIVSAIKSFTALVNGVNGLTDPFGVVMGLLGDQVMALLNGTCQQVLGAVMNTTSSLSALARLCLPLQPFGQLTGLQGLNLQGCTGSTQIPLISGGSPWPSSSNGNDILLR